MESEQNWTFCYYAYIFAYKNQSKDLKKGRKEVECSFRVF